MFLLFGKNKNQILSYGFVWILYKHVKFMSNLINNHTSNISVHIRFTYYTLWQHVISNHWVISVTRSEIFAFFCYQQEV